MKLRETALTGALSVLLGVGSAAAAWWVLSLGTTGAAKPSTPPIPATVPKVLKEEQIATLTLTAEAVERLALRTGAVERKRVRASRVYGGEVTIPAGRVVVVSAPLGGILKAPTGGFVTPGRAVKKGQPIFELSPLLTPEGRVSLTTAKIDADGQVETTTTQLEAAKIALDRAKRLFRGEAGSRRAVDEAQAQYDLAKKASEAATARRDLLKKVSGGIDKGTAAPLVIESPDDGILRNVSARPGQNVPGGAALFEVANLDRVWVRVPVYVGDLPGVDAEADASVAALAVRPGEPGRSAVPVAAPPSANPAAGTADLFYELDNRKAGYSPGHRVGVSLTLRGEEESLTVPWSAVLLDIHGGTWVYERTGERAFTRRRVQVRFVAGQTAVLAAGPPPGTKVVTAGAAELFGTETGFSK